MSCQAVVSHLDLILLVNNGPLYFILLYLFLKIKFYFFGCVGSSLLRAGFLYLWRAGATLHFSAQASPCSGFSCCGARTLSMRASVVVAHGL